MRNFKSPLIAACLSLPAFAGSEEPPKTNSSLPIEESQLTENPYNLNGIVFSEFGRGSGVVANNRKLFLTAAHVLYDDGGAEWSESPLWFGGVNSLGGPEEIQALQARGYFRWVSYANQVGISGNNSRASFSRDVALAWSGQPFTSLAPAELDYKGAVNLRNGVSSMITGYPAMIDYTGEEGNYFLHTTVEEEHRFKSEAGNYVYATHISTGPGNSGGPVWIRDKEGGWKVGGLLVSGRPSEAGIYGFTSEMKTLFKSANPAVGEPINPIKSTAKVEASIRLAKLAKPKTIPDGRHKWTRIPLKIGAFPEGSKITFVRLNLTITTAHRGDLIVGLMGPNGTSVLLHDGEGAGSDDLVIDDLDLSLDFAGAGQGEEEAPAPTTPTEDPTPGRWHLMVQDRLTGDVCKVTRFQLEVGVD